MYELTVNEAIELSKTLNSRIGDLESLRNKTSVQSIMFRGDNERTEKNPLYNPVDVDSKMVNMKNAIRKLNSKIKESNASVKISIDCVDPDALLSPIEAPTTPPQN